MRISMIGTRGVPATYGGFETAIEEIGKRLVHRGHDVVVYCRAGADPNLSEYLGMKLIHLPAIKSKALETLSHTALTAIRMRFSQRVDVAFVFNAANAPFLPLIRARKVPVAVHVDGLEWKRGKWGRGGRRYYRAAEQLSVRWADALIADAQGISDYYRDEFDVPTELISYGTDASASSGSERLAELGLTADGYHLVVARFEPENHVNVIVDGYSNSAAKLPLVVVGSAPYSAAYTERIAATAAADARVLMLGGIWDQTLLDQLYANARTYLHGHSVGGTNPSLLRAMGAGTAVIAWDVVFNREVVGSGAEFFTSEREVTESLHAAERDSEATAELGKQLRARAVRLYNWDDVALQYEELAARMFGGHSTRGGSKGKRAGSSWNHDEPSRTDG